MARQPEGRDDKLGFLARMRGQRQAASGDAHADSLSPGSRSLWIAGAVIVALVLVMAGFGAVTSSASLCSVCHEMRPSVASWRVSPHAEVNCYSCHAAPHRWYAWPLALVERGTLLTRDVRAHYAGTYDGSATASGTSAASIPDSRCLQCHDPARTGTSRFGILVNHAKHAERNKSCVSCHLWTAHLSPGADRDTLMMKQCFKCHGLTPGSKAPGACAVCHIKGIDLHPDSHKTGSWLKAHGKVAKTDRAQCVMCHRDDFCANCHGLTMPHPEGWAARGKSSHATAAKKNTDVCTKCHKGTTNLCTMCHHKGYDDTKGTWVSQHFLMVQQTGSAFCMQCHEGDFCVECHSKNRAP